MRAFAKSLVDKADVDSGSVRFGVLIYSTEVLIQFHLNRYQTSAEIKRAIDNIPYIYGSTNSADALRIMHIEMFTQANGDRLNVDNIAFMITDGISNINYRRTIPEAEAARTDGIHIYAIGIGLDDTRELDGIASVPSAKNSFNVKEFDELENLADNIFGKELCGKICRDINLFQEEELYDNKKDCNSNERFYKRRYFFFAFSSNWVHIITQYHGNFFD